MSRSRWIALVVGSSVLAGVVCGWRWFRSPMTEYIPIITDGHQNLVVAPIMATPDHLDRVERVLGYYGETHTRVSPEKLLVTQRLASDRDLIWNYTSKANDKDWMVAHPERQ